MEENNKMKKQSRSVTRTQNLLKTGLIELMQEKSVQQIEDEQRAGNAGVFYSYCISGCIGLIENWISGDMHRSADEMAATIAAEFVLHGFQAMAAL